MLEIYQGISNHNAIYIFAGGMPLPWHIRIKIMLGAAKGLAFLHEEARKPLIFRDFKTSNILLDMVIGMLIAYNTHTLC